jgi:DNA processing protein
MTPPELADRIAVNLVPGLGPRLTAALLEHFGSYAAIRRASASDLARVPRIGAKLAASFATALRDADVEGELALMERHGVAAWPRDTSDYPAWLAELDHAPPILYGRGSIISQDQNAIGIVGTRHPTPYGRRMAERLAAGLARAGWTVVSGLARGVDGWAHRSALAAGGRTIAVLAGGLSRIYPPEHADLATEVAGQGAVVTESAMRQEPLPMLFPARNRIISGLSRGIVVVEAGAKSGALITADHAGEQGREVFAVPGPVDSLESMGCHALIRNGARLVRHAEDILEDLAGLTTPTTGPLQATPAPTPAGPAKPPPALDGVPRRIWDYLTERRHADEIARHLELGASEATRTLTMMELTKVVRRLPGNHFERIS